WLVAMMATDTIVFDALSRGGERWGGASDAGLEPATHGASRPRESRDDVEARGGGGRQGLPDPGDRSRLVRGGGGRVRLPPRPQRLWQDHTAADRRRSRAGDAPSRHARRRAGRGRAAAPAPDR